MTTQTVPVSDQKSPQSAPAAKDWTRPAAMAIFPYAASDSQLHRAMISSQIQTKTPPNFGRNQTVDFASFATESPRWCS